MNPASTSNRTSWFHRLATFSLIAPIVAIALQAAFGDFARGMEGMIELGFASLQKLLWILGVVAAIVSLFGIRAYGKERILWKALTGILVPTSLFLFGWMISGLKFV